MQNAEEVFWSRAYMDGKTAGKGRDELSARRNMASQGLVT